jgi:hypothetical protein
MIKGMLTRVWRSRFTWKASVGLTAAGCLTIVTAAGIEGTAGTIFALVFLAGWFVLFAKMAENEARHVVRIAQANGSRAPNRHIRRLLVPWWLRACGVVGVLALTLVAISWLDDGLATLTFVLALLAAWLIQQTVIALRGSRD